MDQTTEIRECVLCGGSANKRLVRCLDHYVCHECTLTSIDRLINGGMELLVSKPTCIFCGQEPSESVRVVGNEEAQICSNCLKLAVEILIDESNGEIKSLALSNERKLTS